MANACSIDFQGNTYELDKFKDLLKSGLLFNLLDRGVIDLPINKSEVQPSTPLKGFEQNFPVTQQHIQKALTDVFKLPTNQAKAVSDVYGRVARSWAIRNNRPITDYFQSLSIFKGAEVPDAALNQIIGQIGAERLSPININNLKIAQYMQIDRKNPDEIYYATGWEKGKDGKWRMESKYDMNIKKDVNGKTILYHMKGLDSSNYTFLDKVVDYPSLFKAYPDAKNIRVTLFKEKRKLFTGDTLGRFTSGFTEDNKIEHFIELNEKLLNKPRELQETIIHEIQHFVQAKEKFANDTRGKNYNEYFKTTAEVEARNAARRSFYTTQERDLSPISETEDVLRGVQRNIEHNPQQNIYDIRDNLLFQHGAFHGSPYLFNKFITDHIDSDNQFGWGLYFTDSKDIAQSYSKGGYLYDVTLHKGKTPDQYSYLDWKGKVSDSDIDKISKQGIKEKLYNDKISDVLKNQYSKSGNILYRKLASDLGSQEEASKFLLRAGIDGIKIPKESKNANNYVIFDPAVININNNLLFQDNSITGAKIANKINGTTKEQVSKFIDAVEANEKIYSEENLEGREKNEYDKANIKDIEDIRNALKSAKSLHALQEVIADIHDIFPNTFAKSLSDAGILTKSEAEIWALNRKQLIAFPDVRVDVEGEPYMLRYIRNQEAKGAILLGQDGKDIIYALSSPDVSTPIHELAHRWERELNDTERGQVLDWAGHDSWTRETSEKFARGFEKYLADGKAPKKGLQNLFDRFKQWLIDIYKGIKGSAIDMELNEPMKEVYAKMLGENYEPKLKEEIQQEALNEATPVTSQEPQVQKPQTEQQSQIQPSQQISAPAISQTWDKPFTGEEKDKIGYAMDVQKAYRTGAYDIAIANGEMDEQTLRDIFASAGQSSNLADRVIFRATNKGLEYSIDNLSSLSVDPDEALTFQMLGNHFIASGRLGEAMKNDMISPEDVKTLLNSITTENAEILKKKEQLKGYADALIEERKASDAEEPAPEKRISDAERRIAELKAQLGETKKSKEVIEEVGLDDVPTKEFVPVSKDEGIRSERLPKNASSELKNRQKIIVTVAERIRKVLPSVPVDLVFDDAQWKGRIKEGRVEINMNYADRNTPIHELMHPFVLALREGHPDLHFNLTQELRTGQYSKYIDDVANDSNYNKLSIADQEDEALTRYLGDSIEQYVKPDGTFDIEKVNTASSAFKAFYTWLTDILNQLWNKIGGSKVGAKLKGVHDVDYITYNKDTGKIYGFKARSKEERVDENGNKIKEVDNRTFGNIHIDDTESLLKRGFTEQAIQQIKDIANSESKRVVEINRNELSIPRRTTVEPDKVRKMGGGTPIDFRPSIDVSELPVDFTLQNMVDVIAAQDRISFDFSAQQSAIDKLEAYQFADKAEMDEFFKKLNLRLETLEDTATRRIMNGEIVPKNLTAVRRILRDYEGMEAVTEYVQHGIRSLQGASWLINNISEQLSKARQGLTQVRDADGKLSWVQANGDPLTDELINKLNRHLVEARTLFGFYDDVAQLYSNHRDEFDEKELSHFNSIFTQAELNKKKIGRLANSLVAEWLYPTLEKAQQNLPEERRITKEQLQRNLWFADQDISNVSYWMGSVVNSRDPINSILAVLIKDKLTAHHTDEADTNFRIRTAYGEFLQRTGIANTPKAYEDYVKKNYLREANIWEHLGFIEAPEGAKVGDPINLRGKQGVIASIESNGYARVEGYVNRWAFHEKYMMDRYADDLRLFKENYEKQNGHPVRDSEWNAYNKAISDWVFQNSPEVNPDKYLNPEYDKIANDSYFQLLYNTYKQSNEKYGERKLNYGIIPQAYKKTSNLRNFVEDVKTLPSYIKQKTQDKNSNIPTKIGQGLTDVGNYLFDQNQYMKEQDINLDGSYYRGVKSPFTHLIDPDKLDFRLNESVLGFQSAANTFASLREVQANVENFKMLIDGNAKLGIQGRQIANRDKNGKVLFDRFMKKPENQNANKLNKQVTSFINDIFYGDAEFQTNASLGKININLNSAGRQLGFLTALQNMAGNVFAGVSNITIGNVMSLGESIGAKYYKPKNWAWAQKEYFASVPNFLGDLFNPVKSKVTQLGILYDAIQGEFRDKYGKNITGNVMKRYATNDTFFIINHTGEHQIQLVGMLALMDATKVKLRDGSTVSLYDAYKANDKGFYKLREDAVWSEADNAKFIKTLHGISRDLNGNYAAYDKSMLQRYWWGKLAIQYRKYLYPAWRSRFASERVDYERGEVITGYYRQFLSKFWEDTKEYNGNVLKSVMNVATGKGFSKEQLYSRNKALFDISMIVATTMLAAGLAGMEKDADEADKKAMNSLLLTSLRLHSDISQYSWTLPAEVVRTINNPSASLNLVKGYGNFFSQLLNDPTSTYSQNGSGYQAGDSKLGRKFEKLIPLYRQWLRLQTPDQQVKYYSLINKNVQPF